MEVMLLKLTYFRWKDKIITIQLKKIYKKIRDNQKFESFEELKNQILKDINLTKDYFINIY